MTSGEKLELAGWATGLGVGFDYIRQYFGDRPLQEWEVAAAGVLLVASIANSIYRRFYHRLTPEERLRAAATAAQTSYSQKMVLFSESELGDCLTRQNFKRTWEKASPADRRDIRACAVNCRMTLGANGDGSDPKPNKRKTAGFSYTWYTYTPWQRKDFLKELCSEV